MAQDVIFDDEEKEDVERLIWGEDGINEDFDREVFD